MLRYSTQHTRELLQIKHEQVLNALTVCLGGDFIAGYSTHCIMTLSMGILSVMSSSAENHFGRRRKIPALSTYTPISFATAMAAFPVSARSDALAEFVPKWSAPKSAPPWLAVLMLVK